MEVKEKKKEISDRIEALTKLVETLNSVSSSSAKLSLLEKNPDVVNFLNSEPFLNIQLKNLDVSEQYVIKALLAIGQGSIVFQNLASINNFKEALQALVEQLLKMEKFYDAEGGIIGYHIAILKLLNIKDSCHLSPTVNFEMPIGLDISQQTREVKEAVRWGIDTMRLLGEMYPVGGAGDRLNLKDEETGELLPAAQLQFCGKTLFELLVRDLYGREFLYYKLLGRQLVTPLAIMTSHEKKNHQRILELCEANEWFGRPRESYRFFIQPLVPMVTMEGNWAVRGPMHLILKPGGHGVIWKAAINEGIFDWFEEQQKKKVLVRQINNPIAGVDSALLALLGIGCHKNKDFGFVSCNRLISAAEGMDVLREVKQKDGYDYCITNVEYTEFKQCGIEDVPEKPGSPYSRFPANTNILFGDLSAIKEAVSICSIPGMLINMKTRISCYTPNGSVEKFAGRLESTMQNIADFMVDRIPNKLSKEQCQNLRTFLIYNDRRKTISVTKKSYEKGKPLQDTPEGCFYDLLSNYRDLLINYCHMNLPLEQGEDDYLAKGPDCIMLFHPALGGLYSVIGQKLRGGKLSKGSELILEISEAHIVNLDLDGSLVIEADSIMGKQDAFGTLKFDSNHCGKCTLINVKVKNQGRERISGKNAWRCEVIRKEVLKIVLYGNAEFYAQDVELEGNVHFEVPENHRLVVYQQGKEVAWHFEKIEQPTWKWEYFFEEDSDISLEKAHNVALNS